MSGILRPPLMVIGPPLIPHHDPNGPPMHLHWIPNYCYLPPPVVGTTVFSSDYLKGPVSILLFIITTIFGPEPTSQAITEIS